ncbi:hypothetical protein [Flyfo microvirus Tbat2_108]|nr:hypothetical protein [Flyfo microvirus Tbat2_108]
MRPIDECCENPFGRNEYFLGALIGGLFARSSAKKAAKAAEEAAKVPVVTDTTHTVDLLAMNNAAIEAGYNPMTLLNAGGLSAFTTTKNVTTGQNAMAAAQAKAAVPSMGSVFAGALGGALDSLTSSVFQAAAPMSKDYFPPAPPKTVGMADALGWNTLAKTAGGAKVAGSSGFVTGMNGKQATVLGNPMVPEAGEVTVTNPWPVQKVDPYFRDAEGTETRSSDVVSNAYGVWVTGMDWMYDMTGISYPDRMDPKQTTQAENEVKWLAKQPLVQKVITQGITSVVTDMFRSTGTAPKGGSFRTSATGGR